MIRKIYLMRLDAIKKRNEIDWWKTHPTWKWETSGEGKKNPAIEVAHDTNDVEDEHFEELP